MKRPFLIPAAIVLAVAFTVFAADPTIKWFHQQAEAPTVDQNYLIPVENSTSNGYRFMRVTTLSNQISAPLVRPSDTRAMNFGAVTAPSFSGSGSNLTTLQAQEAINAKAYGVKGDGTTDDRAALNALFAAGGRIFLPAGTYVCSGTITIPDKKIAVVGQSHGHLSSLTQLKFTQTNGAPCLLLANTGSFDNNVLLDGFEVLGNAGTGDGILATNLSGSTTLRDIYVRSVGGHGVHMEYSYTHELSHVEVRQAVGDGFHIANCNQLWIKNSRSEYSGGWGVYMTNAVVNRLEVDLSANAKGYYVGNFCALNEFFGWQENSKTNGFFISPYTWQNTFHYHAGVSEPKDDYGMFNEWKSDYEVVPSKGNAGLIIEPLTNRIPDSSFVDGTIVWGASACSISVTNGDGVSWPSALKVKPTDVNGYIIYAPTGMQLAHGDTFWMSCWVKPTITAGLDAYQAIGPVLQLELDGWWGVFQRVYPEPYVSPVCPSNQWTKIVLCGKIYNPADTAPKNVSFQLKHTGWTDTNQSYLVTDVQFVKNPSPSAMSDMPYLVNTIKGGTNALAHTQRMQASVVDFAGADLTHAQSGQFGYALGVGTAVQADGGIAISRKTYSPYLALARDGVNIAQIRGGTNELGIWDSDGSDEFFSFDVSTGNLFVKNGGITLDRVGYGSYVLLKYDGTSAGQMRAGAANKIDFLNGAGDHTWMSLKTDSGYVGIGTQNPSSLLEVNGTVTGYAFKGDGSQLTNVPSVNLVFSHFGADTNGTTVTFTNIYVFAPNGTRYLLKVDNAGTLSTAAAP